MKKLATFLLFAASMVVSLVVLELLIRVARPRHSPAGSVAFHYNADRLYLGQRNTSGRQWRASGDYDVQVAFNEHGFRDAKDLRQSTTRDLFVVGDSFSFGWGVEEPERYSDRLQALSGRTVYNISIPNTIPGYGRLVAYARERGATIDSLLVGVCMENDLKDYAAPRPQRLRLNRWAKIKQYFKSHTALYSALSTALHQHAVSADLASRLGLIRREERWLRPSAVSPNVLSSSAEQTAALVTDSGAARVAVVVIPSRTLWLGDERDAARTVHDDFVSRLRALDLQVVDLRPAFEAQGQPLDYHFRFDGHWNAAGHHLAAETIHAQVGDWLASPAAPNGTPPSEGSMSVDTPSEEKTA